MADGSMVSAIGVETGRPSRGAAAANSDTYSIDDAIDALQSGVAPLAMSIDMDGTVLADLLSGPGLLQRLKGHRMLEAIATGEADLSKMRSGDEDLWLEPAVAGLLDAVRQTFRNRDQG